MTPGSEVQGQILISPKAIATIAAQSALESYGVVGMTSDNIFDELAIQLDLDPHHGVEVKQIGDTIQINLFIVIEYGTRISSVAKSVANTVRYHVENAIGMPVSAVNVHVQDLRVSNTD
ncbi:MAG: Asp23/Gls24 family envelope stress response protein [Anaerolineales bacterium]|nr:Asp23/Gls24 family envelope stress response protein [Anaerolineales bacterium]